MLKKIKSKILYIFIYYINIYNPVMPIVKVFFCVVFSEYSMYYILKEDVRKQKNKKGICIRK